MIPKVSILVPTYNGAKYIASCLESALSQSFGDFEVIVCDDVSKDETVAIVRDYQKKDARIKFFQNSENLGLVGNWNRALTHAQGDWIKYLFQDDFLAPTALEKFIAIPDSALIACSRVNYIIEPGVAPETRNYFENDLRQIAGIYPGKSFLSPEEFSSAAFEYFPKNIIGEPIAVFFHRRAISSYGFYNADLIMSCDYEYFLRLAINEGIYSIDEPLVSFTVHSSSTSADNLTKKRFRMETMDILVMLHEMVFNPHYEKFRSAMGRSKPDVDLVNFFAYSSRRAFKEANMNSLNVECYQQLAATYPLMELCKNRFKVFSTLFEKIIKKDRVRAKAA